MIPALRTLFAGSLLATLLLLAGCNQTGRPDPVLEDDIQSDTPMTLEE